MKNKKQINKLSYKQNIWKKDFFFLPFKEKIIKELSVSDIIAEILAMKFFNEKDDLSKVKKFISPTIKDNMLDPLILNDMEKAANYIILAMKAGKKLAVFGDYDVDGGTSSALLVNYFQHLDYELDIYIPDRQKEGYGPNIEAFRYLREKKNIDLVITVDCGASAHLIIEEAKKVSLDVIILDHHLALGKKPDALAVVNPNHEDEQGEYKYLAAVGVCFLLLVILNKKLRLDSNYVDKLPNLLDFLDIVALGTVCDIVPLVGLNRAIVKYGLLSMVKKPSLGIKSLLDVAEVDREKLSIYHLGFVLGPRINAGGRVGDSYLGAKLLSSTNILEATDIAKKLNYYNQERKALEKIALDRLFVKIEENKLYEDSIIIVDDEDLHIGVIGILASRIKDRYNKPVAIISFAKDGVGKASARSIRGVDFGSAIVCAKNEGFLENGGGHKMAAGFTILRERLENFKKFIFTYLAKEVEIALQDITISYQVCFSINSFNFGLI